MASATPPTVSVIVPCRGTATVLPPLLRALRAQTLARDRYEILIVDPYADGGHRIVEQELDQWDGSALRLVRGPFHGGPAARRNCGIDAARGELLAFTDADCLPEPEWLEAGLRAHEDGAEMIQGRTLPPDGAEVPLRSHRVSVPVEGPLYQTCNMFYGRDLIRRIGGFSSRYLARLGSHFGEDVELGWRARRAGAQPRFEPNAVVRHPVGTPSTGGHLRERWHVRGFPMLVRDVPELRDAFLYRRWFLNRRTAKFTAALAAAALGQAVPPARLLALPYACAIGSGLPPLSAGPSTHARRVGMLLLSDATTAAALLYGSARARALVL